MRLRALRELADRQDAMGDANLSGERTTNVHGPFETSVTARSASGFAELVRDRMDGPVLRYSHRTRLLSDAARRGIGRFEANLIIAAVQHQLRHAVPVMEPRQREPEAFLVFALVQTTLMLAAYLLLG